MDDHHFSYMTKLGEKKNLAFNLALSGTKVADSAQPCVVEVPGFVMGFFTCYFKVKVGMLTHS
jgi:hypothetical protein